MSLRSEAVHLEMGRTYLRNFVKAFQISAKLLEEVKTEEDARKALAHLDKSSGLLQLAIAELEFAAGYAPHKVGRRHGT